MTDLPSNSRRPRNEPVDEEPTGDEKIIKKVVTGGRATQRKPTIISRLKEMFGGADGKGVLEYVIVDVAAPALRDLVADALSEGIQRMIFGNRDDDDRRGSSRNRGHGGYSGGRGGERPYVSHTPYHNASRRDDSYRGGSDRTPRRGHDIVEIVLDNRQDAEDALFELRNALDRYRNVSIGDLYGIVDIDRTPADESYGWFNLRYASVRKVRDGYLLDLPKPEPLNG